VYAVGAELGVHVSEVVEDEIASWLDLGGSGVGVSRHPGIGVVGVDVDPVEVSVGQLPQNDVGQAVVRDDTGVTGDRCVERGEIEIDDVQLIGIARGKNVAREIAPVRANLGDTAAARQQANERLA
jgi:hypothetical protein